MKPQREGGGNNIYGTHVGDALKKLSPIELESYILMSRIYPKESSAVCTYQFARLVNYTKLTFMQQILVRNGNPISGDTISELGMYSVGLFDNGQEIFNEHAGHLLRTKLSNTDEGGVAAGFAVLSSPFLA